MKRVKYCLALVLTSLILGACGAGVSLPAPNAPPSLGGIWKGQVMSPSGATLPTFLLVSQDGKFFSVAPNTGNDCADVAQGSLLLSDDDYSGTGNFGIISATGDFGVQIDCSFSDGSVSERVCVDRVLRPRIDVDLDGRRHHFSRYGAGDQRNPDLR